MGRSSSIPKTELIATRVTPRICKIIKAMAASEGLYASEWVRKVIIKELKSNKMLTTNINHPILEETYYNESRN
ncbi:hypothetical protein ACFL0D_04110 [Thermoproteota archaeon]